MYITVYQCKNNHKIDYLNDSIENTINSKLLII